MKDIFHRVVNVGDGGETDERKKAWARCTAGYDNSKGSKLWGVTGSWTSGVGVGCERLWKTMTLTPLYSGMYSPQQELMPVKSDLYKKDPCLSGISWGHPGV